MKTILVTGSQGFIGSYLCKELLDHGYRVIGIDNFSKYGEVSRPHDNHRNFRLFECDVIDLKMMSVLKEGDFDCIIAGAAMIGGIHYFHKYAYDLLATNERIMAATFDFAIEMFKRKQLNKIVTISSSMVFENTTVYPTPESEVTKTPPPSSTYGFQKLSSEYFCKGAFEQYGLPYIIIRPFNCVGIGEDEAEGSFEMLDGNIKMMMSHVVPDLIYKCFAVGKEGPLPILGSGNQVRHYTYGGDIARGIRMAIENTRAMNDDFNISSDKPLTVMQLASIIWKMIHGDSPCFAYREAMQYDVQVRSPDTSKAKDILGFTCQKEIEDVLPEIIQWVKERHGF